MPEHGMHAWAQPITVVYVPGYLDPMLERALSELLEWFRANGSLVQSQPTNETDLILTTARFGQPLGRDEALLISGKRKYGLSRRPQVLTVVSLREKEYDEHIAHFTELAAHPEISHQYPGLGPQAVEVLVEQAQRGGPEVALGRLMQAQMISIRVMALIGEEAGPPLRAIHFDLAGAHPTTDAANLQAFADETGRRILTAVCAHDVDHHSEEAEPLPRAVWESLTTPEAMIQAGVTFTRYGFFTTPIAIEKILGYKGGIGEAIAAQYSEGCYAVYEPEIPGLITTATGSSRLVDKRSITRDDHGIVVGVKPERDGAKVMQVEGRPRTLPSVEAVEMMGICEALPPHPRKNRKGEPVSVPPVHAILHGHLGVQSYDPKCIETVFLDGLYYDYLVSCGTGALASGTAQAFMRSATLRDFADPLGVVFLEQPGHGVVIIEKWVEGKDPFETIHEYLETGRLKMTMQVPQGRVYWGRETAEYGRVLMQKAPGPAEAVAV
ncbi:MAG: hypothetical protein HY023_06605 [Chloroflexi bacterium]|nr:hypothetical protein [Chloroflexota bacterium]